MRIGALLISVASVASLQCGSPKISPYAWVQLKEWDRDDTKILDREEFINGYLRSGFDLPWMGEQKTTSCLVLSEKLFAKLDSNSDGILDSTELIRRQVRYLVGTTFTQWKQWDDNGDSHIASGEFTTHAVNEHLCRVFDPDSDGIITSANLAAGNFSICDQDNDNRVGGMEFYLWEIQQGRK